MGNLLIKKMVNCLYILLNKGFILELGFGMEGREKQIVHSGWPWREEAGVLILVHDRWHE